MKKDRVWTQRQGQAGVYQVASQLLLRDVNVSFPAVDDGADLIAEGSVRIQIKAAHLSCRATYLDGGAYWWYFNKSSHKIQADRRRGLPVKIGRVFSATSDVVCLWGIEQNRFWIVPAVELDNEPMVVIGATQLYEKPVDVEKIKELRDSGMTYKQISDALGVSRQAISCKYRGKALRISKSNKLSCSYESRWDVIISLVKQYKGEPVQTAIEVQEDV